MIYISHRGNIEGKSEKKENNPDYIMKAVDKGFDVEIDVWFKNNDFYLGHDSPMFKVDKEFICKEAFWCHAKNIEALYEMSKLNCHHFWHQNDDYTITSKGIFWAYPGKELSKNSICVLPELSNYKSFDCLGICSDFIMRYKNEINQNVNCR
jgi:hypothetical protein